MKNLAHDSLYMEINGALCADNTLLDVWTDATGKHVTGEALLLAEGDADFDFERARMANEPLTISIVRGGSGERATFTGKVSRAGMRCAVGEPTTTTFQLDEIVLEPPPLPSPF